MSVPPLLYLVQGVEIGRTWYVRDGFAGGYYAVLSTWPRDHAALGPFRTLHAAQKALERVARNEGSWPREVA